jgi:large conductance mechanosensitive channel
MAAKLKTPDVDLQKLTPKWLSEFQAFILRGSVIDLAIGVTIGAAFTAVVTSLVNDIIMPPIGYLLGGVDFTELYIDLAGGSHASLAAAREAGAPVIAYGAFLNTIISLVIIGLVVFWLIRVFNRLTQKKDEAVEEIVEEAGPTTEEQLVAALEKLNQHLDRSA